MQPCEQLELTDQSRDRQGAFPDNRHLLADQLCLSLSRHPDWLSAAQLGQMLDTGDREIRAAAEAAHGRIISGQKGYKHIQHATPEEIAHFVNWMESQAKRMLSRAQAARQTAHKLFG